MNFYCNRRKVVSDVRKIKYEAIHWVKTRALKNSSNSKQNEKTELIYKNRTKKGAKKDDQLGEKQIKRTQENEKKLKYETSEEVTRKHHEHGIQFNGEKKLQQDRVSHEWFYLYLYRSYKNVNTVLFGYDLKTCSGISLMQLHATISSSMSLLLFIALKSFVNVAS